MAPETRKLAEEYVKTQLGNIEGKVPAREVKEAIKKVAQALEEIRVASIAHQSLNV